MFRPEGWERSDIDLNLRAFSAFFEESEEKHENAEDNHCGSELYERLQQQDWLNTNFISLLESYISLFDLTQVIG
jgi:hypothetical protein